MKTSGTFKSVPPRAEVAGNGAGDVFVNAKVPGDDSPGGPWITAFKPAGGSFGPLPEGKVFGSRRGWDEIRDPALRLKLLNEAATFAGVSPDSASDLSKHSARAVKTSGTLPHGSKFFDVDDIPVALVPTSDGGADCLAFDTSPPRGFDASSMLRNGSPCSAAEFDKLVSRS